jgi:class 3 adenylate cyclase/tetratricopeptide (TPR) repeat protein
MLCPGCGTDNPDGKKFCGDCGTPLEVACPSCASPNPPGKRFCGECGAVLDAAAPAAPAAAPAPPAAAREPAPAERRLVSVLFADLVGFTALSERRDAEEVRELLSRYFDTARRLIELYGGTVEKFIGDAVMAVWGTPTATEDDAERAVRAALDLVAAVSALGQEVGAEELRARAGVLTGEAAVTIGAEGQGMVAGDLVNTASRVQSAAEPGQVYVGESTRRATEQGIVFEEAGSFELKGKEGMIPLWRALRVVSGVRGSLKSQGLEAPFVGRDRELRQIKDLFHTCADEGKAHLVSVTGIAGIGKSRLAWEFYKYFDGLAQTIYWHRGRCLAYGEGVTYWALADMVRMRCRIAEDESPVPALEKLRATLDEHLLDAEERQFVEPRVAQLLGLGEHEGRDRQDLFAAWRLFFERLADVYPTVLAFEDMQWADASLLDFVEYLLDWSRNSGIYVITLARPELLERRPNWGAGQRNFSSLYLEPLSEGAMEELLGGLVPGLPARLREQILARAEGVPLYAVETVRMLLDRGALVQDGAVYAPAGEIESLEVPETLHALIAARLDGLSADERRMLQDAAVLGKTFTADGVAALTGLDRAELDPLLGALVRKEVLGLQADPRSPEHGQYGFLQDLVRHVAYETLSRRERRARHLAAAEYLTASLAEEEVAEVVASHLSEAYRLDPEADDAGAIKERAREALSRAGERAASLGASAEARHYFEQAAELTDEPGARAASLARAGETALLAGEREQAAGLFEQAAALYTNEGDTHAAARVTSWLALVDTQTGRVEEAVGRMEQAYEVISTDPPDADLALLLLRLGSSHWFAGRPEQAAEWIERGLDLAESLDLPEMLVRGWMTKAMIVGPRRPEEARILLESALRLALDHEFTSHAGVTSANLSDLCFQRDRYVDSLGYLAQSIELARRIGNRASEWFCVAETSYALSMLGRWQEALAHVGELPEERLGAESTLQSVLSSAVLIHLYRGEADRAQQLLARFDEVGRSSDVQAVGAYACASAAVLLAGGRHRDALAEAERAFGARDSLGIAAQDVKHGFWFALEAALALGQQARAEELLATVDDLPPGLRPPFLDATARRFRARLAGDAPEADAGYAAAAAGMRALELPFHLAVVELEHAEWLAAQGREGEAEPLLAEAREIFEQLEATPWLERAARIAAAGRRGAPVGQTIES